MENKSFIQIPINFNDTNAMRLFYTNIVQKLDELSGNRSNNPITIFDIDGDVKDKITKSVNIIKSEIYNLYMPDYKDGYFIIIINQTHIDITLKSDKVIKGTNNVPANSTVIYISGNNSWNKVL